MSRYDIDRCMAMANHIKAEAETTDSEDSDSDAAAILTNNRTPTSGNTKQGKGKGKKNRKQPKREHSLLSSHWEFEPDTEPEEGGDEHSAPTLVDTTMTSGVAGMGGMNKKARRGFRARRKSQAKRNAEKVERMRWESAWKYMNVNDSGTGGGNKRVRGYLSYMCKIYLVRPKFFGVVIYAHCGCCRLWFCRVMFLIIWILRQRAWICLRAYQRT
jgi:hypothetical protein